jgi:hypothetical protein
MSYTVNKFNDKPGYTNKADGTRSYSVKYIVESTTANDLNIHAARKATGMPVAGSAYEYDSGVFLSTVSVDDVKFTDSKTIFYFNAEYEIPTGGGGEPGGDDPLNQPVKVTYGNVKYQVPFDMAYKSTDAQGSPTEPVVNTAGQKFDPPAVKMKINSLISLQYNVRIFRQEWQEIYTDTINLSAVNILGSVIPVNCARINELTATNAFDSDGKEYWQVNVSIEKSKTPFTVNLLNQGFMALNSTGILDNIYVFSDADAVAPALKSVIQCKSDFANTKQLIADGLLEPVQEPQKLDENGQVSETPLYTSFKQNYSADWSPLLIPKRTTR